MLDNSISFGNKPMSKLGLGTICFGRNSCISTPEAAETSEKSKNRTIAPVPMLDRGRYYSHSKPGGPLSQDTHTSSGLSIYGLGVCT